MQLWKHSLLSKKKLANVQAVDHRWRCVFVFLDDCGVSFSLRSPSSEMTPSMNGSSGWVLQSWFIPLKQLVTWAVIKNNPEKVLMKSRHSGPSHRCCCGFDLGQSTGACTFNVHHWEVGPGDSHCLTLLNTSKITVWMQNYLISWNIMVFRDQLKFLSLKFSTKPGTVYHCVRNCHALHPPCYLN